MTETPTSVRSVLIGLAFAAAILIITHFLPIPGGLRELTGSNGGLPILDQKPSFSADEVYQRLGAFGEAGRQLYRRYVVTTDVVFPLSFLAFFFLLARFSSQKLAPGSSWRVVLLSVPFAWFSLDMIENLSIFAILSDFPQRNVLLSSYLGFVSVAKRYTMFGSLLLPLFVLILVTARRLRR